jgi:hypothetical protein
VFEKPTGVGEAAPNSKHQAPDARIPRGTPGGPTSQRPPRFVLTEAQRQLAVQAFESALADSVLAYDIAQLGLFHDEDETFIRREVERMLYDQKLPNGGEKEKRMIERLRDVAAKADKEWTHLGRVHHAISEWNKVLPANPRNAGRYYTRRPLTVKEDKDFFKDMMFLRDAAHGAKD